MLHFENRAGMGKTEHLCVGAAEIGLLAFAFASFLLRTLCHLIPSTLCWRPGIRHVLEMDPPRWLFAAFLPSPL